MAEAIDAASCRHPHGATVPAAPPSNGELLYNVVIGTLLVLTEINAANEALVDGEARRVCQAILRVAGVRNIGDTRSYSSRKVIISAVMEYKNFGRL